MILLAIYFLLNLVLAISFYKTFTPHVRNWADKMIVGLVFICAILFLSPILILIMISETIEK
jgi:hypothetical protein